MKDSVNGVMQLLDTMLQRRHCSPRRKRLAEVRAHLDAAKAKLEEYRTLVKALEKGLERVEGRLERAIAEKEELQKETSALQKRINMSGELTRALTNEKVKWEGMMVSIEENATKRLGDALLGAAFFAYCGRLGWKATCKANGFVDDSP